ncbi:uncharacterized protein [Labrus bergylta]|uniref:uncharacterized protein n=1 Tax=Labrus bergylta TaxID=56723 RepID=UPI0009B4C25A|nr:uncharacterized protein LOC110001601 [Labrus bergylta]
MKVCHTLIFFVFILTPLQEGQTCFEEGLRVYVHTGTEGKDITMTCVFDNPNKMKRFCREGCRDEDVLVETSGFSAQRGRYTMKYVPRDSLPSVITLFVSIKQLTKADSGRYSCVFGDGQLSHETQVIDLRVQDAPTTSERKQPTQNELPAPAPASTLKTNLKTPAQNPTTSEPFPLSTSAPPASTLTPTLEILATPAAARGLPLETNSGVQLNVKLVLIIMIITSSAALLIVCRRTRGPKVPHVGLEDVTINAGVAHEEAGEKILEM